MDEWAEDFIRLLEDKTATINVTKPTLAEVYEQYATTFIPGDTEVTCTLSELGDFVKHIHEGLLANYDVTPNAGEHWNKLDSALRDAAPGGKYARD